jgi:hypothetical protein
MHLELEFEKEKKELEYRPIYWTGDWQSKAGAQLLAPPAHHQLHSPINSGYFSSFRREA